MIAPAVYRSVAIALMPAMLCVAAARAQDIPATQFVLLSNGNVLQGEVHQDGGIITVSNGPGRVVQLSVRDVHCWADNRLALYRYRVDNRQGGGVDAHLADAQWCLREGLLAAAAEELQAAYRIHPRDPRLPAFERRLRHAADAQRESDRRPDPADPRTPASADATSAAPAVEPSTAGPAGAQVSSDASADLGQPPSNVVSPNAGPASPDERPADVLPADDLLPSDGALPLPDVSPADKVIIADASAIGGASDALAPSAVPRHMVNQFVGQLQPLLINRCGQAGCHGGSSGAAWQLAHSGPATQLPSRLTGDNLEATLRWVDRQQPEISPLLVRATSPHGGASDAPLGAWDAAGIAQLRQWITALAERCPPGDRTGVAAAAGEIDLAAAETSGRAGNGALDPQRPMRLPPVADPFDPDVFNRRYHPVTAQ